MADKVEEFAYIALHRRTRKGMDFATAQHELGGAWFVALRVHRGEKFTTHCGPYSDEQQAKDWIDQLREDPL